MAYRVIGQEEDARDVAQETFLRAFRALPGFKGQAKFSSWIYRIALNLCRDWIRRKRRTPVSQMPEDVDLADLAAEQEPSESVEDLVARRELSAVVEEAMTILPEEQRTAVILKEYHGMVVNAIYNDPKPSLAGALIIAAGVPLFYYFRRTLKSEAG